MKKTKEIRKADIYEGSSAHGRSTVKIECPFCGFINEAFIWSINANGKKCQGSCKDTIFYRSGDAHKR